ncbi:Hypothetical_protein [Hexamita inflata]|uniref:Hypothetical_protein n=1 Tax=Hexamita inflata TaxID=28002 RepID=A0AA86RAM3_9EUKA|nr:Hypothetical protein HINF_LOCUS57097 [Hexamita inflata]
MINFNLLPNSKKQFEGPPLYKFGCRCTLNSTKSSRGSNCNSKKCQRHTREVWSGNLKYRAGRLRGNRLCRTFSFSRGTCFSPSRQRRVPECACSFPQRRAVGAASWARIGRTKYDMAVAESA